MYLPRSAVIAAIISLSPPAFGQAHAPGHGHAGADAAPDAVDSSRSLPAPPLMDGIGGRHFAITTRSQKAQAYFDQGVSLLHCFWEFEALRAFREAARLDPDAPMVYWGIHSSIKAFDKKRADERKTALGKMKALLNQASEREQFYMRATLALEERGEKAQAAYVSEMEALVDRYPDDIDAKLFLALFLMNGYDKDRRPKEGQLYSQAILRELLRAHPDNAAANHYWIHAQESSRRPEAAMESAERLARMAPRSAHMVHMPGHIFYRTGDYGRARQSFLDSLRIEEEYMRAQGVAPADAWNYEHNLSYLSAACAEMGRYREAVAFTEKLQQLPQNPEQVKASSAFILRSGGALMRLHIRFGNWQAVIAHPLDFGVGDAEVNLFAKAYRDGLLLYAQGMSQLEKGDVEAAGREAERFESLLWQLIGVESKPPAGGPSAEVLKVLTVAALELRGNLLSARGRHEEAFKTLKLASDKEREIAYFEPPFYSRPSLESLGYAYLRAGRWQSARDAFTEALGERPRSGHLLYGIARSYALEKGRDEDAARAYETFAQSWAEADADLPQLSEARAFHKNAARRAAKNGVSASRER